ncbi:MAG: polysaccharide deacetylase family protein [Atopobiaceae bacterium]|nr:polysaccharide deacetylase family protein [Atopobiaceae bacterium]
MANKRGYSGAHFKTDSAPQNNASTYREPRPRRGHRGLVIALVSLVVLGALAAGGVVFWMHRPVSITVNGQQRTVFKRSTIDDLYRGEAFATTPGDFVAVTGKVIKEGGGDPYSATVNGTVLTYEQAKSTMVWGNESIEFGDGANVLEEHTTEVVDEQPKLEYRVVPGTAEKGDQVQQGVVQYVAQWGKTGRREILHGTQTGETATGEVEEETKNLVIVAQNIHPDDDKKLVALTFDDGPTYFTTPYLDILDQKDVKATFSIIGEQITDGGATVIADTASRGHQIISHTTNHLQLTTLDEEGVRSQLGDTSAALKDVLGHDVMYLRPPYGDIDEQVWLKSGGLVSVSVYWTHDSRDWEMPGVDAIVNNCTINMAPGSVILMHDGGGDRNQDIEALPRIIDAWKDAGYTFVTVEELLKSDSSISFEAIGGGEAMPEDVVWPTEIAS